MIAPARRRRGWRHWVINDRVELAADRYGWSLFVEIGSDWISIAVNRRQARKVLEAMQ